MISLRTSCRCVAIPPAFVLQIKQLPAAAFASAVGMWATRLRCPSEAAYPQSLPPRSCLCRHAMPPWETGCSSPDAGGVRREVLYRLHPWFGRHVVVHEVVNKAAASSVFRCTLDGSEIERHLEIPAWMFDRATCAGDGHFALDPFVSLEALNALSILINQLLKTVVPSLTVQYSGACGNSHEKNRGATHDGKYEDSADRKASQDRHRRQADGSVRKRGGSRDAKLDRSAGRSARVADRPDDQVGAGSRADDYVASKGGRRRR